MALDSKIWASLIGCRRGLAFYLSPASNLFPRFGPGADVPLLFLNRELRMDRVLRNFHWLYSPCSPCWRTSSRLDQGQLPVRFLSRDYKKPCNPSTHMDVKYHLVFTTGTGVVDECISEANAIGYNERWVGKKRNISHDSCLKPKVGQVVLEHPD